MKNVTTTIALLILSSCIVFAQNTETRTLASFNEISIDGAGSIYLAKGDKNEVTIKLKDDEYDISDITTEVERSRLTIDYKKRNNWKNAPRIDVWITYVSIEKLSVNGAGKIFTENAIKGDKLVLSCSGAENATLEIDVNELKASLSGAGSFSLKGRADIQNLSISGAGKITAEDLLGKEVWADVSGVGSMTVYATESLKGKVSGVGNIRYAGNPKVKDLSTDGIGSIKPIN